MSLDATGMREGQGDETSLFLSDMPSSERASSYPRGYIVQYSFDVKVLLFRCERGML